MLSVTYCGIYKGAPEKISVRIEACPPFDIGYKPYYRLELGGVSYTISDAYRRQILKCLSSAPPLPEPDAQIDAVDDCECHFTGDFADASECDLHNPPVRNAAVAEPLRGILADISLAVPADWRKSGDPADEVQF